MSRHFLQHHEPLPRFFLNVPILYMILIEFGIMCFLRSFYLRLRVNAIAPVETVQFTAHNVSAVSCSS